MPYAFCIRDINLLFQCTESETKGDSTMRKYGFLAGCIILACGVMWSPITLAVCPPHKDCKQSIVLAKKATAAKPFCLGNFECLTVATPKCDDCIWRMQWRMEINSNPKCDETMNRIPDKSILSVDITYHIRRNGPCATPVGTHEGKFKITHPTGAIIATGKMKGTMGLETHDLSGEKECCAWPHDEGCMDGTFTAASGYAGCQLTATYSSTHGVPTGAINVCNMEYWLNTSWNLNIDGIVQCKCQ